MRKVKKYMTNEEAIKSFRDACNELAERTDSWLFDGEREKYWVGGDVGGTCCFGDTDFLSPEEMVLILEHGMTYDEYDEWVTANLDNTDRGYINLQSWLRGCRHDMLKKKGGSDED